MRTKISLLLLALLVALFMVGCSSDDDPSDNPIIDPPPGEPLLNTVVANGSVDTDDLGDLVTTDLSILTGVANSRVAEDGTFEVQTPDIDGLQLVMMMSDNSETPIMMGLMNLTQKELPAIDRLSTALALTLINPYLSSVDGDQRLEYVAAVQLTPAFATLLAALDAAYDMDMDTALDYNTHPEVYQQATLAMKEAFIALGTVKAVDLDLVPDPPYLSDLAGSEITITNPRFVFYGAEIDGEGMHDAIVVSRQTEVISAQWGWPPVYVSSPVDMNYDLGDGTYTLNFSKGWDFGEFLDMGNAAGIGTTLNTSQVVLYVMDLILSGITWSPDHVASLPGQLHVTSAQFLEMELHIAQMQYDRLLLDVAAVITSNTDEIGYWIWQSLNSDASRQFLHQSMGLVRNVAKVLEILNMANEKLPFVYDCVNAPNIAYEVRQVNGVLEILGENKAPLGDFEISPPAGLVETEFFFNPDITTDDRDDLADLLFRWDYTGDGIWDTNWVSSDEVSHTYGAFGVYSVIMEVKDTTDLVDVATHLVFVGSGNSNANHVKLFRNVLPWSSNATLTVLQDLGFVEGVGAMTYEVFDSSDMATEPIIPGVDLVILTNDQNQLFYNDYSANQVKFADFVFRGGSLFWGACDEGWSGGSMGEAGVVLPGGISSNHHNSWTNTVTNPDLPLVAGLPETLDHNYASHEDFENLPDGSIVYCVDDIGGATLVELNLGLGWIIITGQPLEHQYDNIYNNPDMEVLLPRIVSHFTGVDIPDPAKMVNPNIKPSTTDTRNRP